MKQKIFIFGMAYVLVITAIGIWDTINDGVKKREEAQIIRSERLEKNQEILEEKVAQRQQKMAEDMKR